MYIQTNKGYMFWLKPIIHHQALLQEYKKGYILQLH